MAKKNNTKIVKVENHTKKQVKKKTVRIDESYFLSEYRTLSDEHKKYIRELLKNFRKENL